MRGYRANRWGVAFGPDFEPNGLRTLPGADSSSAHIQSESATERLRPAAGLLPTGVALQARVTFRRTNVRTLYGRRGES